MDIFINRQIRLKSTARTARQRERAFQGDLSLCSVIQRSCACLVTVVSLCEMQSSTHLGVTVLIIIKSVSVSVAVTWSVCSLQCCFYYDWTGGFCAAVLLLITRNISTNQSSSLFTACTLVRIFLFAIVLHVHRLSVQSHCYLRHNTLGFRERGLKVLTLWSAY